ncbi:YcjX family protein [Oceanicella actignis]|uniref:YcjX family protein n=1 Tax=Oceanicella actignis TaxID=1189325 RepID=A0A1M7SV76_9RHOB|nr:YcjX family protein [Oceanicella actignis]SES72064.1 hypothetical protein SAMN04488119_101275 [Oceanicella actignis]SHN62318.1 hypothetical protein SAMN05216200_103276 [Oceanicella actignis]
MGIADIADEVARLVETAQEGAAALFEPTVRLGVTGLSRAGKTVFITSLVANLLDRGRMPRLRAAAQGRIEAAQLRPQPDRAAPRFDFETHLGALLAPEPRWPESTRAVSQLRLSLRLRPEGWLAGLAGPRVVHLDIVDYPGEWLLDLALLDLSYDDWSERALAEARAPARALHAAPWLARLGAVDPAGPWDEGPARALAEAFAAYLEACRRAGLSGLTPGRFLMPGDLAGSPALTFSPLPRAERRGGLRAEMAKRFEAYKRAVVRPFFRDHFARIDRQVVLVDVLSALGAGPQAVADLRASMTAVLDAFRPGENSWLAPIIGRRVDRILFAAAKADHVHHTQHDRLAALTAELLRRSRERAAFKGARVEAMALASLRATVEQDVRRDGRVLHCVRGRLAATGREAALHPGDLPEDPRRFLDALGAERWPEGDFRAMDFAPPRLRLAPGDGPPHLRLDAAAEFLLGDKLS